MKFQSRDPRSHCVNTVKQVCYTDVGVDGKGSMSSGGESRGSGMNDRAYSNQSTEGSKVRTCSDFGIHVIMSPSLHPLFFISVIYFFCIQTLLSSFSVFAFSIFTHSILFAARPI